MKNNKIVVVYDKEGRIVHVYDWSTFEGTKVPTEYQMENEAIEIAVRATSRPRSEFAALHTQAEHFLKDIEFRVDVQKKVLVGRNRVRRS
jgi:hypothetical protein